MTQHEKVKIVARILVKRFPPLTRMGAIHVAYLIIEALDLPPLKQDVEHGDKTSE